MIEGRNINEENMLFRIGMDGEGGFMKICLSLFDVEQKADENVFSSSNIDDSTSIILLVPPPELHLLIGPVNILYEELSKVWEPCEQWIQLHVKREE